MAFEKSSYMPVGEPQRTVTESFDWTNPESLIRMNIADPMFWSDLAKIQSEIGKIDRDAKNEFIKKGGKPTEYASLDNVLDHAKPVLAKYGYALVQCNVNVGPNRAGMAHILASLAGSVTIISACDAPLSNPQNMGSADTYLRRRGACSLFAISMGEDDDGNASSGRTQQPAKAKQPKPEKINASNSARIVGITDMKPGDKSNDPNNKWEIHNYHFDDRKTIGVIDIPTQRHLHKVMTEGWFTKITTGMGKYGEEILEAIACDKNGKPVTTDLEATIDKVANRKSRAGTPYLKISSGAQSWNVLDPMSIEDLLVICKDDAQPNLKLRIAYTNAGEVVQKYRVIEPSTTPI